MRSTSATNRWIHLEGAANVRDVGGLPTADGQVTRHDRIIRSDNLQGLTRGDVRTLVDDHHVRAVADLRTDVEVHHEGPGPMTREPSVAVSHLSLLPEAGRLTDAAALEDDGPVVLPWQEEPEDEAFREKLEARRERGAAGFYLGYLDDRPDSIVAALRLIADTDGATIVHCAAGKDRTGVVVAMALSEVGVVREAVVEDYALSGERIEAIFRRLGASRTYADDIKDEDIDKHRPRAETMAAFLRLVDEVHGGVAAWLRAHGWTEADAQRLREQLVG